MDPMHNNPPATAATISALVATFLTELLDWASVLLDIPESVETSASALLLGLMGYGMGKLAQRHTWPDWKVQQEFILPAGDQEHWSGDLDQPQVYGDA